MASPPVTGPTYRTDRVLRRRCSAPSGRVSSDPEEPTVCCRSGYDVVRSPDTWRAACGLFRLLRCHTRWPFARWPQKQSWLAACPSDSLHRPICAPHPASGVLGSCFLRATTSLGKARLQNPAQHNHQNDCLNCWTHSERCNYKMLTCLGMLEVSLESRCWLAYDSGRLVPVRKQNG